MAFSLLMVLVENVDNSEKRLNSIRIFCEADDSVRKQYPQLSKNHDDNVDNCHDYIDDNDNDIPTPYLSPLGLNLNNRSI